MKAKTILGATLGVTAAVALNPGFTVRRYTVFSNRLDFGEKIRIVHLSDLHSDSHGLGQKRLLSAIRGESPDLIFLTGDIADDCRDELPALLLAQGCAHIAPSYYCTGNHEYRNTDFPVSRLKQALTDLGVTVLDGKTVTMSVRGNAVSVSGVDDREGVGIDKYRHQLRQAAAQRQTDTLSLLLVHRPTPISLFLPYRFSIVFSGHAHGGQVRIPYLANGLFAPDQGILPPYAGGLYQYGDTVAVISRGLHRTVFPPRVFNPTELVSVSVIGIRSKPNAATESPKQAND